MDLAGGEWTALGIGIALLVAFALLEWYLGRHNGSVGFITGCLMVATGIGMIVASLIAGANRYSTLQVEHSLDQQGFSVASVDTDNSTAVVVGPGNCLIRLPMRQRPDGAYYLTRGGLIITPSTLRCKYP